jgi:hypothetical protein
MAIDEDTPKTIILVAVLGFLTIGIIALRLMMRKYRGQAFNLSDHLTIACIVMIFARSAFTTVVLLYGNNNMSIGASEQLTSDEIYRREVGSKITLVNRAVYNT